MSALEKVPQWVDRKSTILLTSLTFCPLNALLSVVLPCPAHMVREGPYTDARVIIDSPRGKGVIPGPPAQLG